MEQQVIVWKGNDPHTASMSFEVDEVGVVNLTEVLLCKDEAMAVSALDFEAEDCPLPLARPWVQGSSADRLEAGMWQVTRQFTGLIDENLIGNYKLYKCTTVANREPIETHPMFTVFAGKPGAEVNGSSFDEEGNFIRFLPYLTEGTKNKKAGITDYYCPIVHLEETMLVLAENVSAYVDMLGFTDDNVPNTPMRPSYPNRSWLLSRTDLEWVAKDTYKMKREWALSGPRGWDVDIYTD